MGTWVRQLLVVLLLARVGLGAAAAPSTVLLRSGDRMADGFGVATIFGPVAAGGTDEFFVRSTSDSIVALRDTSTNTIAASGDPLPAPLAGTFGTFSQLQINLVGAIAFTASVEGTTGDQGLFLDEAGTRTTVALDGDAPFGPGTGTFVLTPETNLVVRNVASIRRWTHATGETVTIATRADVNAQSFIGRPAAAGGYVAWLANGRKHGTTGGVHVWSETSGVVPVVEEAGASFAGSAVAVDADGNVAYVTTLRGTSSAVGAFLWNPQTRLRRQVAKIGDLVDGSPITRFRASIDVAGETVTFVARVGKRYVGLTAVGGTLTTAGAVQLSVAEAPDTSDVVDALAAGAPRSGSADGTTVELDTRQALVRVAGGVAKSVLAVGDDVPGVGVIEAIGSHAAGPAGLAVFVTTAAGGSKLLWRTGGTLRVLADASTPSPVGGTFAPYDGVFAVGDRQVAFVSALIDAHGAYDSAEGVFVASGRRVRLLARRGDAAPGGHRFDRFESVAAGGNAVVFTAALQGTPEQVGLYRRAGRSTARIALTGQSAPGIPGRTLADFLQVVASGSRVLFLALLDDQELGLFLYEHGVVTHLRTDTAAGGPVGTLFSLDGLIALAGRTPLVAGSFDGAGALYRAGGRRLRPVLTPSDPSPLDGTLAQGTVDYGTSPGGDVLVFAAHFVGGHVHDALLSRALRPASGR